MSMFILFDIAGRGEMAIRGDCIFAVECTETGKGCIIHLSNGEQFTTSEPTKEVLQRLDEWDAENRDT